LTNIAAYYPTSTALWNTTLKETLKKKPKEPVTST